MKFVKGMVMGTLISAGVVMLYNEKNTMKKNKMMKKGNGNHLRFPFILTICNLYNLCNHIHSHDSHICNQVFLRSNHIYPF